MAYPHPEASEVLAAKAVDDAAQTVVTGMTTALFEAHGAGFKVEFVLDDQEVSGGVKREFLDQAFDRLAGEVHEGLRLGQDDFPGAVLGAADLSLAVAFPIVDTEFACECINGHKATIVPGLGVFSAGVTQTDDEFGSLHVLIVALLKAAHVDGPAWPGFRGRDGRPTCW